MRARLLGLLRGGARGPRDRGDQRPDERPGERPDGGAANTPPALSPRLLASVRRLEIRARRLVSGELGGEYRSVFRGAGIEFAEAREYVPGDDVRRIDWNVTARMGAPWVKEYVEERELHLVCAVDVSASQLAGRPAQGRRAAAAEVCTLVTLAAAYSHDRTGLLTFSDRVERYVPPAKGARHAMRLVREVLAPGQPNATTSIAAGCDYLVRVLRRRSTVFLISDFIDDGYERPLRDLARRHEVIAVVIVDPLDEALPEAGIVEAEDIERGGRLLLDSSDEGLRRRYAEVAAGRREERSAILRRAGVEELVVRTDSDAAEPVLEFFRRRSRRS